MEQAKSFQRFPRFRSLMLREWMQHRNGWLVLLLAPSLLMAGLGLFDGRGLDLRLGDDAVTLAQLSQLPLVLQTLGWTLATTGLALLLVSLTVLFQLPGLARRDQQDRSIEFWRSLPTGHAQSIAATLLMHLLVLPAGALAAALLGAQLVALLAIVPQHGLLPWLQQPWAALLASLPLAIVRLWVGLLCAVLWLSPLLLLTMAASAWLKRWALPVVTAASLLGVYWLDARLPMPLVAPAFNRIGTEALYALLAPDLVEGRHAIQLDALSETVASLPLALLHDGLRVLASAATPAFGAALLGAALGFALLVRRRQRAD